MDNFRFNRLHLLFGDKSMEKLSNASVAIFGIGGVGSYAAEALVRAGVGKLTLIDFDEICITNTNRQIHALKGNIGKAKVEVMAKRCRDINPDATIIALNRFYEESTSQELLGDGYDYILDCIDHITNKLLLIQKCKELGFPIISAMGAANKIDPTKITVEDLSKTSKCRLAKIVRKLLRKRGIETGIKVVYSTEEFRPLNNKSNPCADNCVCPNKDDQKWSCDDRKVILGSSSYIPPIFGMMMAGEVIRTLTES
jgi:tRNA threonylcarbamoyladenosine dehydratase